MSVRLRRALAVAAIGLLSPTHSIWAVGDHGTMADACASAHATLKTLCHIVTDEFEAPQRSYVHLGGDFYLVAVPNTGRVFQGMYVGNVKTGQLAAVGGAGGDPEVGDVLRHKNGGLWVSVTFYSMWEGFSEEYEVLLERRVNPISKTPYLIRHLVRVVTGLSSERQSSCALPEQSQDVRCKEVGETVFLRREDIDRLRGRSGAVDRTVTRRILAAEHEARRLHGATAFPGKSPVQILEDAGVWRLLDGKPATMPMDEYVRLLRDYASLAYEHGGGRTDLAVEMLDKAIKLRPRHAPAYLTMADALEHLARVGDTRYATTPLDRRTMDGLRASASAYRDKHRRLVGQRR